MSLRDGFEYSDRAAGQTYALINGFDENLPPSLRDTVSFPCRPNTVYLKGKCVNGRRGK